jgi:Radical SAM superfamily
MRGLDKLHIHPRVWLRTSLDRAATGARLAQFAIDDFAHGVRSSRFRRARAIARRPHRLTVDSTRELLSLLGGLRPDEAQRLWPQPYDNIHWPLALRDYVSAVGPDVSEARAASLLEIVQTIGLNSARLNPEQLARLEQGVAKLDRTDIEGLFPHDPWVQNLLLNVWEWAVGAAELTSYPWNVSLPVADVCNARCVFCTSWLEGKEVLKLEQVDRFAEVIRHAIYLGLVGHGEPMSHPRFPELCDKLAALLDPRASSYTITNGYFLEKWFEHLKRINVCSYSISLNAATAKMHDEIMGLGPHAFDQIIESIGHLVRVRDRRGKPLNVYITLVVTRQNIHQVPAFVGLGNRLGVTGIWLRSLLPQPGLVPGLNYHLLPPTEHPDFQRLRDEAVAAIRSSQVPVQADPATWETEVFDPGTRARISKDPPRVVSRLEAGRDRDIRRRNDYLYAPARRTLRGMPQPADTFTRVEWQAGALAVTTSSKQWDWAVSIPVVLPENSDGPGRVDVDVAVSRGTVTVGLAHPGTGDWIDRCFDVEGERTVRLQFPGGLRAFDVALDNAAEGGVSSIARVESVGVRLGAEGQEPLAGEVIIWAGLRVWNAADPLDDGLNPLDRHPRFACRAVYYNLYINEMYYRMNPCCYMQAVPGFDEVHFDGSVGFREAWNAPAMVALRTRLRDGPLFGACKRCPEKW